MTVREDAAVWSLRERARLALLEAELADQEEQERRMTWLVRVGRQFLEEVLDVPFEQAAEVRWDQVTWTSGIAAQCVVDDVKLRVRPVNTQRYFDDDGLVVEMQVRGVSGSWRQVKSLADVGRGLR